MDSSQIRQAFLSFFESKGHKIISSSSLIPDDPSVLLTTAGMQQFKKYFTGELDAEKDFGTKNVCSVQKCFRTSDIDEAGDKTHLVFFEMLGNFSFGDYFKRETISWTFQILTDIFKINSGRITARVFEGSETIPSDKESFDIWSEFISKERIQMGPKEDNFWGPVGNEGPCGACNEVYVDGVEVATLVFVEYYKNSGGKFELLKQKGVDVGWGLERLAAMLNGKESVFETDIFEKISEKIKEFAPEADERTKRILMDHLRSSVFLIADGVRPSNKEAGYVLRRLIRKILAYSIKYDIHADLFALAVDVFKEQFGGTYPELKKSKDILDVLEEEKLKFESAVAKGIKEIGKYEKISGKDAFYLYESFGLPFEIIKELAPEKAVKGLSREDFDKEFEKHQEISRAGAEKKFGGHGLILDTGELKAGSEEEKQKVVRLHTATHLLHRALCDVLGEEINQRGSDITSERARFDFIFPRKMTEEEIRKTEKIVNDKIKEALPVNFKEMPKEEAEKTGALKFFKGNYPDTVKVYYVGDSIEGAYSKEFCGGPHVSNTKEIGDFKIIKEESSSAGIRRVRAVVS
jgi:alanyl-tRNA synthetase